MKHDKYKLKTIKANVKKNQENVHMDVMYKNGWKFIDILIHAENSLHIWKIPSKNLENDYTIPMWTLFQ